MSTETRSSLHGAAGNRELAAKGGRSRSAAKLVAVQALIERRRGVRLHAASREREAILSDLAAAVRTPVRGVCSIRCAATACSVSDRTVRRWLSGEDWPTPLALRRLAAWLRRLR